MRRRGTIVAAAAALAAVAVAVALLARAGAKPASPGPLRGPPVAQGSAFPRDVGESVAFGGIRLRNAGSEPAVLERVTLVDPKGPVRIVGALAAERRGGTIVEAYPHFPPEPDDLPSAVAPFPRLLPLAGYVVPPHTGAGPAGARETQVFVGLASAAAAGRVTIDSFRVDYRVGGRRHGLVVPYAVAICTPREEPSPASRCGTFLPGEE